MKNFLEKIKSKFKKKTSLSSQGQSIINPHRHWVLLLRILLTVVLFLIFFSLYVLYKIKNEQVFQTITTPQDSKTLLKENLLKDVTGYFDAKATKESELKNSPKTYPDPSL